MKLTIHPLGPDLELTQIRTDQPLAGRLRESLRGLAAAGETFARRFYELLFAAAPSLRPLFPHDMAAQRGKLLAMLQWIVANLEHRADLKAGLRELGERHQRYGARPEHYLVVVEVMLAAMAEVAGPAWNEPLAADWRTTLERVAAVMLGRP